MPVAAVDRGDAIVHDMKDPYLEAKQAYKDRYSENFLAAIDHALAFKAHDRPQSIADWRQEFTIDGENIQTKAEPAIQTDAAGVATVKLDQSEEATFKSSVEGTDKTEKIESDAETVVPTSRKKATGFPGNRRLLIAGAAGGIVLIGALLLLTGGEEAPETQVATAELQDPAPTTDRSETPAAKGAIPGSEMTEEARRGQTQQALQAKRAELEEAPDESFWSKLKKGHEESVENSKESKNEETIDDRVKRALGGQ